MKGETPWEGTKSPDFDKLLNRIRRGDEDAAREFFIHFGSHVRRILQFRWPEIFKMLRLLEAMDGSRVWRRAIMREAVESRCELVSTIVTRVPMR